MGENFDKGENLAFQELGRFLATFERITHEIRDIVTTVLEQNGLKDKLLADIILSRLTAEPLATIFQAMIPDYISNDRSLKLLNSIVIEFRNIIEVRNIIIHCYWVIGVGTEDHSAVSLIGIKQKTSKKGIEHYNLNMELLEMKNLNKVTSDFSKLCYDLLVLVEKNNDNFESLEESFKEIKFKSFVNHFNKT